MCLGGESPFSFNCCFELILHRKISLKRETEKEKNVKLWELFESFRFQVLGAFRVWGLWDRDGEIRMIAQVNCECPLLHLITFSWGENIHNHHRRHNNSKAACFSLYPVFRSEFFVWLSAVRSTIEQGDISKSPLRNRPYSFPRWGELLCDLIVSLPKWKSVLNDLFAHLACLKRRAAARKNRKPSDSNRFMEKIKFQGHHHQMDLSCFALWKKIFFRHGEAANVANKAVAWWCARAANLLRRDK